MTESRHDELAERMLDIRTTPPGHATFREPELSADEWRSAYFVLAGIAQKKLDECYAALAGVRERTIDAALVALEAELLNWPTFVVTEMSRGTTISSTPPTGHVHESVHPDNWFVLVEPREGPQYREHYQGNGHTLIEAIDGLTTELLSRRTEQHRWHVEDWMQEGRFVVGCVACEKEAAELFDGRVDWSPA